jgi:hypothetical protein
MSRFRLDHPTRNGVYAAYGHDPVMGFFVDVHHESRDEPIATCDTFTLGRAVKLMECLDFMAEQGFFDVGELQEALVVLADDVDVPARLERVVDVVVGFRVAGQ